MRFLHSFDVVNYRFSQDAIQYIHNSALAFALLSHESFVVYGKKF